MHHGVVVGDRGAHRPCRAHELAVDDEEQPAALVRGVCVQRNVDRDLHAVHGPVESYPRALDALSFMKAS
jgi:hypothetical protein